MEGGLKGKNPHSSISTMFRLSFTVKDMRGINIIQNVASVNVNDAFNRSLQHKINLDNDPQHIFNT